MNLKRTPEELLEQSLGLFKEPSTEAMESTGGRVRARLRTEVGNLQEEPTSDAPVERITGTPLWLAAAAVAVAAIAIGVGSGILPKANSTGDSRVSMDQIATHELFQSGNQFGKTLVLPEDSRVEMHAQTQLSFVRATDGLQILLNEGSILVSAAKQRTGHLYVKTKDLTVSVVGTVFLVKAEQDGSRVAVIEGEVHVEKGTTIETLLPGEQVATSTTHGRAAVDRRDFLESSCRRTFRNAATIRHATCRDSRWAARPIRSNFCSVR
jgi:ferric-dicitrate binding protein FerR (iron transport regulator)